jgi:hypothetical protein
MKKMKMHDVAFHGDTLNLIEHEGNPFVAIKPISDKLGLGWSPQFRKLNTEKSRWSMIMMIIETPAGKREAACLPLAKFFSWLGSLTPSKVKAHIRPMLELYQEKCDQVLFNFWTGVQSDRERNMETKSIVLLAEVCAKKPIIGKVLPLALAGRSFPEIKAAWPSYTKARIVEALEDLVRLKQLERMPQGLPVLRSQFVTANNQPDTLPLFT